MSVHSEMEEYCTENRIAPILRVPYINDLIYKGEESPKCTCGPPPKRPKIRRLRILDILNVDLCRSEIFHYVSLGDLLRSEGVCHQWRSAVHHYLRGARRIRSKLIITTPWHPPPPRVPRGSRLVPLDWSRAAPHRAALYKWGAAVDAAPCTPGSLQEILDHCPNIRELTFYGVPERELLEASSGAGRLRLRELTRVAFGNLRSEERDVEQVTDEVVSMFLQNTSVEEITIIGNEHITGQFLQHLKNHLTSLRLRNCPLLDYRNLLSILNYLKTVTTLELSRNPADVLKNVHLLLDVMPKLEHLELCGYDKMELGGQLKVHRRLEDLRFLSLRRNRNVDDDWLETIARGTKLVHFDVSYCKGVTMTGLTEVCESSRRMSELAVADNDDVTDEGVETLIRLCPNLTILNIQKCRGVTSDLVVYLARLLRRRRRWKLPALRLKLYGTVVPATPMLYSFILDFSKGATLDPKPSPHLGF